MGNAMSDQLFIWMYAISVVVSIACGLIVVYRKHRHEPAIEVAAMILLVLVGSVAWPVFVAMAAALYLCTGLVILARRLNP